MKLERFKFAVCHTHKVGNRIVTGKALKPRVWYPGYPTRDRLEKEIIPELVAMSERGRQDVVFPLGIYIYAYYGKLAYPRNRLYVQQVPEKSFDLLESDRKVVYFINEEHLLFEVARDGNIISSKSQ